MANLLFRDEFNYPLDMTLAENGVVTYHGKWMSNNAFYYYPDRGYLDWASSDFIGTTDARSTYLLNDNQILNGQKRTAFEVSNGTLKIYAARIPSSWQSDIAATVSQPWTPTYLDESQDDFLHMPPEWAGGLLVSNPTFFEFFEGYLEFRARFETGRGMFPALWAFASHNAFALNKGYAEIDVLEIFGQVLGRPYTGSLHLKDNNQQPSTHVGVYSINEDTSGWHTYGLHRTSTFLRFYKDGIQRAEITGSNATWFNNVPMNIMLDLVMNPNASITGGGSAQKTDGTTPDPLEMEVDYVRVWDTFTQEEPPPEEPPVEPPPEGELEASGPIGVYTSNTLIEWKDIDGQGEAGIDIYDAQDVEIRYCRIHFYDDAGIWAGGNFANLNIHHCDIIYHPAPSAGQLANEAYNGITLDGNNIQGVKIDHCRFKDCSTGLYAVGCTGIEVSRLEGTNMRGPFHRGQIWQLDKCDNAIVDGFKVRNQGNIAWTEDGANVYMSNGVRVYNGFVYGNNSPSGVGIMTEYSDDVIWDGIYIIRHGNGGASFGPNASNTIYRNVFIRDSIQRAATSNNIGQLDFEGNVIQSWEDTLGSALLAARTGTGNAQTSDGLPMSFGAEAFQALENLGTGNRIENGQVYNLGGGIWWFWPGQPEIVVDPPIATVDFTPVEPADLMFAWDAPLIGEVVTKPNATLQAGNWEAHPEGEIWEVLSDENDETYAMLLPAGSPSSFEVGFEEVDYIDGTATLRLSLKKTAPPEPEPTGFGPTSIITNAGNWTAQGGSPIPSNVNTETRNDATTARSTNDNSSVLVLGCDPVLAGNYDLSYTFRRIDTGGSNPGFQIRILDGTTELYSWSHTPTSTAWTLQPRSVTLPATSDLRIELTRSGGGSAANRRQLETSWIRFESV